MFEPFTDTMMALDEHVDFNITASIQYGKWKSDLGDASLKF